VLAAAAERIAVTMIQAAFAHLPAESVAGALAVAKTQPVRRMIQAITVEAYAQGKEAGVRHGRLELQREMEDDWRPIAERVRGQANRPSREELAILRAEAAASGGNHPGGPVPQW